MLWRRNLLRFGAVLVAVGLLAITAAADPSSVPGPPPTDRPDPFETAAIDSDSGTDRVGLVDPATGAWHLRGAGGDVNSFFYGNPGDFPMVGDWDCDGIDTPGLYRQSDGFVYLRNSNSQGVADIRFFFGNPGDIPLAGDFDGDGCDTVSIYRAPEARIYIINALGASDGGLGAADFNYVFGDPGDKPFVGDFDGNGEDTIGLHRESTGFVYFRNSHTQGNANAQFFFGDPGDRLVAGDWGIIDQTDTPAVFRPPNTTFYFRHTNTQGNADETITMGEPGFLPVAGEWGDPPQGPMTGVDPGIDEPSSPNDPIVGQPGSPTTGTPGSGGDGPIPAGVTVTDLDANAAMGPLPDGLPPIESSMPLFSPDGETGGGLDPQWWHDLRYQTEASSWVSFASRPGPVGLLLALRISNGVVVSYGDTCTATLMHRRMAITAAHCLFDDNEIPYDGYRFYPAHYPKENREFYTADATFTWPSYVTWTGDAPIHLDYALVRLRPTAGVWPGDKYGWYEVATEYPLDSRTPQGVNYKFDERRSIVGYPVEGFFRWHSYSHANPPATYPWTCQTLDGAYYHAGGGWWLFASGCLHAGGMSGGPIFALRSGRWKIIGVNSSGQIPVHCGANNWPSSYPCPVVTDIRSRFAALYNSWAAPLLYTSSTVNDFDSLWDFAFTYPG